MISAEPDGLRGAEPAVRRAATLKYFQRAKGSMASGKRAGRSRGRKSRWLEFAAIATAFTGVLVLLIELAFPGIPGREVIEKLDIAAVSVLALLLFIEFARAESKKMFLRRYWLDIVVILPFMVFLRLLRGMRAEIVFGRNAARMLIGSAEPGILMIERAKKAVGSAMSIKTIVEVARKTLGL